MKRVNFLLILLVLICTILLGCPAKRDIPEITAGNRGAETNATENKIWDEEHETTGVVNNTEADEEQPPEDYTTEPTTEPTAETEMTAPQEPAVENTTQKTEETTVPDETESDDTPETEPEETVETKQEETIPETEATLPEADTSNMLEGN